MHQYRRSLLDNVLPVLGGDVVIQRPVDVVQVSQHALRQLNDLLIPVTFGHLEQRRVDDRQNDDDVVADQSRDVLIAPV